MDTSLIGFAVLLFLAIVLLIEGIYLYWNSHHGPAAKRMQERVLAMSAGGNVSSQQFSILKERLLSGSPLLTRILMRMPRVQQLDRLLQQSGLDWSVARFCGYTCACAVLGFASGVMLHLPFMFFALLTCAPALLPAWTLRRKRAKRLSLIERQLPDAADLIGRALRAGHSFPTALGMVGQEMPEPIANEFRIAFDEINYGVSMNDALLNIVTRVPIEDLRYFVIAVLIQREAGGNLAEILGNISEIIRERLKLFGKIRVLSAEGRLSAWILSLLPFVIVAIVSILNPGFIRLLWNDPIGQKCSSFALMLTISGIFWMRKLIRIRV
ncbi:type II secretion system F family protein [Trinickia terrae]|uniref:Type II secretion system F family protein n=1 Tax=Trinickia terrae TaxID=2571161 RepID=A0A4U1IFR6_9BURK|nr:type II secretion system F family protein [Trinickia terrae]TKC92596.1 type II secretion system F family protein [Trinickia terrae]